MKSLKFFMVILCACLMAVSTATSAELKFTTQDLVPFNYEADGKVAGPFADIIRIVCADMNVKCTFRLLSWGRAQALVKNGEADGMFVCGKNKARESWVTFSPPILNTEYGFFVQTESKLAYKQPSDIIGLKIAAYGPSNVSTSLEKLLSKDVKFTIDMRPDDTAGFKKLAIGRVDAVYSNRDVGLLMAKNLKITNIRYAGAQKSLNYYVGFSKLHTDKKLIDAFAASYKKLLKKGMVTEILKGYSMVPVALD